MSEATDGHRRNRRSGARLVRLGGFGYWNGTAEVHLPGSTGAVVAYVALQPSPVRRSLVAGTVWADVAEERACGNLRSVLWRVRRLAPALISSSHGLLSIDERVSIDYRHASNWTARILHGKASTDDLERDISPLSLELLPGLYDDWVVFERERFRQRWLHAAESVARELTTAGRYGEAIEAVLTAIAADPLRESAHRVLVECHMAERNVVEARRQQLAYARLVRSELGIDPSDEFMGLVSSAFGEPAREPVRELVQRSSH